MRVWDVDPGYLARQQLLGEHRELHGLANILIHGKKGYARHPETLRWVGCLPALAMRHRLLAAEMALRGYQDRSPLDVDMQVIEWPQVWIDAPAQQLLLLKDKYAADGRSGRIPLPKNTQQLWAQHKYSVMARSPKLYQELGPEVAHGRYRDDMDALTLVLVEQLRSPPEAGRLRNALLHMWGYVAREGEQPDEDNRILLARIQALAVEDNKDYLLHSTALSELAAWASFSG